MIETVWISEYNNVKWFRPQKNLKYLKPDERLVRLLIRGR